MVSKSFLKHLLFPLHHHFSDYKDLYIITLARAGSTLLAEMLNTQKGTRLIAEPLSRNPENVRILKKYFPARFIADRYLDISPDTLKLLQIYFNDLSQMKTLNSIYWTDLLKPTHNFRTSRNVFKTHRLTYLFDRFFPQSDVDGIYLIRHPISHALSRKRLNWDNYIDLYLSSTRIKQQISAPALKIAKAVQNSGSSLEMYVLNWCLENFVFLNIYHSGNLPTHFTPISYEEIIAFPEETVSYLRRKYNFSEPQKMLSQIKIPSSGIVHSVPETVKKIRSGSVHALLGEWREQVSELEEQKLFRIIQAFGFDLYQVGNDLPENGPLLKSLNPL